MIQPDTNNQQSVLFKNAHPGGRFRVVLRMVSRSFAIKAVFLLFIILFFITAVFSVVRGAFNPEINYQAKLTDTSDVAVADGSYNLRFRLCTASDCTGGSDPLWTETHCYSPDSGSTCDGTGTDQRISVTSGLFSVLLGSITSLSSVDFNQTLYLEVQVGGSGTTPSWETLTPRKELGAVPAAFEADKLDGIDSGSFLRSDAADIMQASSTGTLLTVRQDGAGNVVEFKDSTTTVFIINDIGNIGIGTTTPGGKLSVAGGVSIGSTYATTTPPTDGLIVQGNVGIGDTSPDSTLEVVSGTAGDGVFMVSSAAGNDGDLLMVKGSGKVGIGTTAPGTKLNVAGDITITGTTPEILFTDTSSGHDDWDIYVNSDDLSFLQKVGDSTWTQQVTFQDGGNVGIGDTSPDSILEVVSSGGQDLLMVSSAAGNDGDLFIIDSSGNVGIGTTTPGGKLEIYGGDLILPNAAQGNLRIKDSGGTADIVLRRDNTTDYVEIGDWHNNAAGIQFYASGTEYMRLGATGNVGIGDTSPDSVLEVVTGGQTNAFMITSGGTDGDLLTVLGSGNVGIGDTTPAALLTVGSGDLLQVNSSGNLTFNQTSPSITIGNTGTLSFSDGTYTLAAIKDQGAYVFWNLLGKSTTGDPGTCSEGDIYYNAQDDTIKICHSGNTWEAMDAGGVGGSGSSGQVAFWTDSTTLSGDNDFYWDNSQKLLGIGITTPAGKLSVAGGVSIGSTYATTTPPTDGLIVEGKIGIGTTDPLEELVIKSGGNAEIKVESTGGYDAELQVKGSNEWTIGTDDTDGAFKIADSATVSTNTRFTIDNTGNVGIGDTSPDATLEVVTSGNLDAFMISSGTEGDGNMFIVKSSGNVGIGTTTPDYLLDVRGGSNIDMGITSSEYTARVVIDAGTDAYVKFRRANSTKWSLGNDATGDVFTLAQDSGFGSNRYLVVDSSGNVGIGDTSPDATLEVVTTGNNDAFMISSGAEGDGDLFIVDSSGNVGIGDTTPDAPLTIQGADWSSYTDIINAYEGGAQRFAVEVQTSGTDLVSFYARTTRVMTLDENGRVGIGDTSPDATLEVVTSGNLDAFMISSGAEGDGDLFIVDSSGNVGIGTASPGKRLDVLKADSEAQVRISQTGSVYSELKTDNVGDLTISATGGDIKMLDENLYICAGGACAGDVSISGTGNLVVENEVVIEGQIYAPRFAITYSASITVDWSESNVQFILLEGNPTLTFSNGKDGGKYVLILRQDSTGSRTVTWPSDVRWSGGTAPTLTTTASKSDYIGFIFNGFDSKYDGVAERLNF